MLEANEKLVCPECGNDEFTVQCPAVVELTFELSTLGEFETRELILDIDRDGDYTCTDCGDEYYDASELSTEDDYNESEDE